MKDKLIIKKLSFFAAVCMFLSAVEAALPKPVPFFRLGLANLPIMLSFVYFSRKESVILIFLKILIQGIVSGTVFSYVFIFSLAGSLSSGLGMMGVYVLFCKKEIDGSSTLKFVSWVGISLCGGLLNNTAQLLCGYFLMFGKSVSYIAPFMLLFSFTTSLIMGIIANWFNLHSKWFKAVGESAPRYGAPAEGSSEAVQSTDEGMRVSKGRNTGKAPVIFFVTGLLGILLVSFAKDVILVYVLLIIFAVLTFVRRKKIRLFPSVIVILSVTILSLLNPYGKILFSVGTFKITEGALTSGLMRSGKLCAMVFMSQTMVDKNLRLPGKAGLFMTLVFNIFSELTSKKMEAENKTQKREKRTDLNFIDKRLLEVWRNENVFEI
ncbi:MAG: Gx transporter family protein [Treponema sp.]|nr:Gx transporter family protein [Treponema sp.]